MMLKIVYYQVDLILFSFVEIKVSLRGLSKFKEGVSKIRICCLREKASISICKKLKWIYPEETKR